MGKSRMATKTTAATTVPAAFDATAAQDDPGATSKGELTRPASFSLEAFLAGRVKPVKTHRVTVDPDTAGTIQALRNEKAQIELAISQVADLTQSKRRMAQKDERAERIRQIDAAIAELEPTLDGTWLEVQFRPMSPLEQDEIRDAGVHGATRISAAMWEVCAQVRPDGSDDEGEWASMSAAEWLNLIDVIGIPQFQELDQLLGSMTYSGRTVTPDFFGRSSKSPATTAT